MYFSRAAYAVYQDAVENYCHESSIVKWPPTCTATADSFLCASAEEGDVLSARGCWELVPSVGRPGPEERESRL